MAIKVIPNCGCCDNNPPCRIYVDCGCNWVPCISTVYFNSCCIPFPSEISVSLYESKTKGIQNECDCIGFLRDEGTTVVGQAVWKGSGSTFYPSGCSATTSHNGETKTAGLGYRQDITVTYNCPSTLTGNNGGTWSVEIKYYEIFSRALISGVNDEPILWFTINPTIDTTTCSSALNGKPGFTFTFTDDEITGTVPSCFSCGSIACCGGFNDSSCIEPDVGTIDVDCCVNLLPDTLIGTVTNVSGCSGFSEGQTITLSNGGASDTWFNSNVPISCKAAGSANMTLTCLAGSTSASDFSLDIAHTYSNCNVTALTPTSSSCSPINLVYNVSLTGCQCCNPAENATYTLTITA